MAHKTVWRSAYHWQTDKRAAMTVRPTPGPRSKSVLIQKKCGAPTVCNDGVTIAKEIELEDPEENLRAQMLRQAAEKNR
jgi:chaperonin GroEL